MIIYVTLWPTTNSIIASRRCLRVYSTLCMNTAFKQPICSKPLQFFDIGVNATDPQFQGKYRDKSRHTADLTQVWNRSKAVGCSRWLITGGDLQDSEAALALARTIEDEGWMSTAGVHPTRSNTIQDDTANHLKRLGEFIRADSIHSSSRIKAFGEFGLDYDRFTYSPREAQIPAFQAQLELAASLELPLFLHSRGPSISEKYPSAPEQFKAMMAPFLESGKFKKRGVVHSFTGTQEEMESLVSQGFSIGINGCSLKTAENMEVVRAVPMTHLMLESDAPWCDMRATHASSKYLTSFPDWWSQYADTHLNGYAWPKSKKVERYEDDKMVRSRNEPCSIVQVAYVVACLKEISIEELATQVYSNTCKMFG